MKKIFVTCGLALLSFGLYSDLFGANTNYIHEDYTSIDGNYQDTTPKRKKDTTGRQPSPRDTTKKDSSKVMLTPASGLVK